MIKFTSAEEAVKVIQSNDRVHLSSVAVTPHHLINAMVERGKNKEFKNVRIQHIHTEGSYCRSSLEPLAYFFTTSSFK